MPNTYPTEEELKKIEEWSHHDLPGWFAYIKSVGNYWSDPEPWGWHEADEVEDDIHIWDTGHAYYISTGGWSGNESIISSMGKNFECWAMTWAERRRGGHYKFVIEDRHTRKEQLDE